MPVRGEVLQPFGARILIACAMVGAIYSTEVGISIISGFTEAPKRIRGAGVLAARTMRLFVACSSTMVHPGNTSINKSPERFRLNAFLIL